MEENYATELIAGRSRGVGYLLKDRVADVAEFLDVVMHDESLDYRLEQVEIGARSPLLGRTLHDAAIRGGLAQQIDVALMKLCYVDITADTALSVYRAVEAANSPTRGSSARAVAKSP